jgi:serine phosphatase RsbU (regulator of sigma subunit)
VADVADKGMGAALVMSMASTLFRSYAGRHVTLPAIALDSVNERLHSDTRGGVFVSAFLGILEPHTGRLRYANAGHPPPIHIRHQRSGRSIEYLERTGMVLGVLENHHWKQKMVEIGHEDVLVLYTDGVLDAQDALGSFYGIERLEEVIWQNNTRSAEEILEVVLKTVEDFTRQAASVDDQALVVLRRLK